MSPDVELSVRGNRVLIRPESPAAEGSVIVVQAYAPDVIGTVMAKGERVSDDIHAGDVVLFTSEAGQEMEWIGQTYLVLYEDEILAVWHEDEQPV